MSWRCKLKQYSTWSFYLLCATNALATHILGQSQLAGWVYIDRNNDGILAFSDQPNPEYVIGDVLISLFSFLGNVEALQATARTDDYGRYLFDNINPGTYTLRQTPPVEFVDGIDTLGHLYSLAGQPIPGNASRGVMTNNAFLNIVLTSEVRGDHYNFGERGLAPGYISKRYLLASAPEMNTPLPPPPTPDPQGGPDPEIPEPTTLVITVMAGCGGWLATRRSPRRSDQLRSALLTKSFTWTAFVVAPFLAIGAIDISYANHIDFFDDAEFFLLASSVTGPSSASQSGAAGNILGTEREVVLSFSTGSGFISSGLSAPPGPGPVVGPPSNPAIELLFSNSVNSLGRLDLTYDGIDGAGFAPASDFDTLYNFITVDMSAVQGTGNLSVSITDSASNSGSLTGTVASAGTYSFPFTHPNYASVDFSMVSRVVVRLETTLAASDFAINQITREAQAGKNNIPEPSAMLLALMGIVRVIRVARKPRG